MLFKVNLEKGVYFIMLNIKNHQKDFIVYGEKHISYANLLGKINYYSTLFDINADDRTVIFSENRPEWIYSFFQYG